MNRRYLLAAIGLSACVVPAVLPAPASAFCIYNKSKKIIRVEQLTGQSIILSFSRGYKADLQPGEQGCVNWKESGVNTEERRDADLGFTIYYRQPESSIKRSAAFMTCKFPDGTVITSEHDNPKFFIKAGGWLEIRGEGGTQESPFECVTGFDPE